VSLPPSRFGAGFTVGGQTASRASPAAQTFPGAGGPLAPHVGDPVASGGALTSANGMNTLAVLSFVSVLLLGPLVVAVSIPMAVIARVQINRRGQSGGGLVIATLALSVIYLAFGVVVLLLLLSAQTSDGVGPT
jgi:hypothetical protein